MCGMMLIAGCAAPKTVHSGSDSHRTYQPVKPASMSELIRSVYKVSSEAGKDAQQRAALLSSNPELRPILERAEKDPGDKEARSRIVREYLSRELYWGAYALLTNNLPNDLNDPDVNIDLAFIWDAWGQFGLAQQYADRAINNGATSAHAFETMGRIRLHQNEPAASIEWFKRSMESDRSAPILANLGYAHMLTGEWTEAKLNLEEAVALSGNLEEAHNNLALVLSELGDDAGALAHLLKAARPAAAYNNMGVIYQQKKRFDSAQRCFEAALQLEPAYETARRNMDALRGSLPASAAADVPVTGCDIPGLVADANAKPKQ